MKNRIIVAQRILKEKGLYNGKIDGDAGPKTRAALVRYNGLNTSWRLTRQITQAIQFGHMNAV